MKRIKLWTFIAKVSLNQKLLISTLLLISMVSSLVFIETHPDSILAQVWFWLSIIFLFTSCIIFMPVKIVKILDDKRER
jgi:hypothetical protein